MAPARDRQAGRSRRSRTRRVRGAVLLLAAAWVLVACAFGAMAAVDAYAGVRDLDSLRSSVGTELSALVDVAGGATDDIPEEGAGQTLTGASERFERAHARLDSPVLMPLRYVPVLGRQLDSARSLTASAAEVTGAAATTYEQLTDVLDMPSDGPDERVAAAERISTALAGYLDRTADLDLGPDQELLPPLATARNRFAAEAFDVEENARRAMLASRGVAEFLTGPTRYLVLAANNAEMRAGSAMYLQVGVLEVAAGTFDVDQLTPTGDIFLEQPGAELDPDNAANWEWLVPSREWRNLNLSPRFDESARMAAEMWEAAGGEPVDGVIAVDVIGLRQLLELIGPVDIGTPSAPDVISADSIERDLFVDQYADFIDDRDARRDRLGRVAESVLEALNERPVAASEFLRSLQRAGEGRHVLMWSSRPAEQDAWAALEVTGELPPDAVLLSVLNRGGNKLDQFLEVDATIRPVEGADRLAVDVQMQNSTPPGLPPYVAGPHPRSGLGYGDYYGILTLNLPAGSSGIRVTGADPGFVGLDGDTTLVAVPVLVRRGAARAVSVEFDLHDRWDQLQVLPSARVPPVTWSAGDATWDDTRPAALEVDSLS